MPRITALVLASLALAAPASATATETAAAASCPTDGIVQPFAVLGDTRDYVLAPGGAFEGGPEWTLTGDAAVVSGNEPFLLNGLTDARSLRLGAGASATSPTFCVDLNYPTFRLPVRSLDDNGASDLVVEVRYPEGADTSWKGVRTETGAASWGWRITEDIDMKPDTHSSEAGARPVQIRFSVKGKETDGGWHLDSVFVDPRMI